MTTENMLTEITIKNFKCFTDLHLEGFERVNLIGGKNNVGKTAFLEAVELNALSSYSQSVNVTFNMLVRRQKDITTFKDLELDFINDAEKEVEILSNEYSYKYYFGDVKDWFTETDLNDVKNWFTETDLNEFKSRLSKNIYPNKVNFIKSVLTNEHEMIEFYGVVVDLNKEFFLNESLKLFDENIIALKQRIMEKRTVFKVQIQGKERAVLLSSLGEGVNWFITMLCAIWASQDGFLFIDEIENGIHYTNYPKLWNITFQASKDANCQLFITTHSKECIQAFNDANTADEGAYFEFYKNLKKNKITAQKLDNQQLNYALSHDGRVRGE